MVVQGWDWDEFETYRLPQNTLEEYLQQRYGQYDFSIKVVNSWYKVLVPGKLSYKERKELRRLRYYGGDYGHDGIDTPGNVNDASITALPPPSLSTSRADSNGELQSVSTGLTNYSSLWKPSKASNSIVESDITSPITLRPAAELPRNSETQRPANDSFEDDADIYSDAGSLEGTEDDFTKSFADWLLAMIPQRLGETSSSDLIEVLPVILQEFAVRLGHEGKVRSYRDLMYVAHKPAAYRAFVGLLQGEQLITEDQTSTESGFAYDEDRDEKPPFVTPDEDGMDWKERVGLLDRPTSMEAESVLSPTDPYEAYRVILREAEATDWLLSTLKRDLALRGIIPSTKHAIRATVLDTLRGCRPEGHSETEGHARMHRISPNRNPYVYLAHFQLQWDPVAFLNQEFSEGEPHELFSRVITVTGDGDSLQALPCQDYMTQTWPFTAAKFLALIKGLVTEPHQPHEAPLSRKSGSWLKARLVQGRLCLAAQGIDYEIAEIAEQLAWIGSALQIPDRSRFCVCQPRLSPSFQVSLGAYESDERQSKSPEPLFLVNFHPTNSTLQSMRPSSECWQRLFDYMAIAHGFPIPSRPTDTPGLEIPLDIATDLIGAEKAVFFKARALIKGFSTMLYPTKVDFEDGTIIWHLLESEKGARISYADARVGIGRDGVDRLRYKDLETARHIIGWCPDIENITGTARANYAIRSSDLDPPPQGWVLENLEISAGQYILPTWRFSRSKRARTLKISRDKHDLIARLEWLEGKHVILHDTRDRRAWLVDGPSALLHLVRTSLKVDSQRFGSPNYSVVFDSLRGPAGNATGRRASFGVLTHEDNLEAEIRAKKDTINHDGDDKYRFKHRLFELLGFLEQIMDHQTDMKETEGIGFRLLRSDWNHLEGFDFVEVACRADPLSPKHIVLREDGRGWVDFTRAIRAITLFGQGFGDLLCPVTPQGDACAQCYWNSLLPKDRDILAVSMEDLEYLHQFAPEGKWGSTEPGTRTVLQKFTWERPASCFAPCACMRTQVSPARIQSFRENPQSSKRSRAKAKFPPDAGEVSTHGGVLLGIPSHKTNPTITVQAPQSQPQATENSGRDQGTASLSSLDGSRYASTSATSAQPMVTPVSTGDVGSPTTMATMTARTGESQIPGLQTSPGPAPPSHQGEEGAMDRISRADVVPSTSPVPADSTTSGGRDTQADALQNPSSPPAPAPTPGLLATAPPMHSRTSTGSGKRAKVKDWLKRKTHRKP